MVKACESCAGTALNLLTSDRRILAKGTRSKRDMPASTTMSRHGTCLHLPPCQDAMWHVHVAASQDSRREVNGNVGRRECVLTQMEWPIDASGLLRQLRQLRQCHCLFKAIRNAGSLRWRRGRGQGERVGRKEGGGSMQYAGTENNLSFRQIDLEHAKREV